MPPHPGATLAAKAIRLQSPSSVLAGIAQRRPCELDTDPLTTTAAQLLADDVPQGGVEPSWGTHHARHLDRTRAQTSSSRCAGMSVPA